MRDVAGAVRLLDLFCGAGGAAMGYSRAGFTEIVGVDIKPQPRYPFILCQWDALLAMRELIDGGLLTSRSGRRMFTLKDFAAIHASPPCQGYSRTRHLPWLKGKSHPLLIPEVRALLRESGLPYVIENVGDAPLDGIALRGGHFGLPYVRLRRFESNVLLLTPDHYVKEPVGVSGKMFGNRLQKQHKQLGIDSQAIPPEYTEFIGRQLLAALSPKVAP